MKNRLQFLPRHLYFRYLKIQFLLGSFLLVALWFGLHWLWNFRARNLSPAEMPAFMNDLLLYNGAGVVFAFVVTSLWSGLQLVLPLGRLIQKARHLTSPSPGTDLAPDEMEQGEWLELEDALNSLQTQIAVKNEDISRDREEIAAIISAISDPVLAIDRENNLLFFNSQFAVIFGGREIQMRKPRLPELIREPEVLDAFEQTIRDGQSRSTNIALQRPAELHLSHYTLSIAPIRSPANNQIYGAVGIFHNVTELKRADQVRIDFVANVSHELRTPLTSIKGYTQTLQQDLQRGMNDNAQKYLSTIDRNVERLIHLVSDLLNLSSLESGAVLELTQVPLKEFTERVATQLEGKRQERGQSLQLDVKVPTLRADARRLEQVVTNLIENAIKYVPPGGQISVIWDACKTGEVCLHVIDNGPGIDPVHHSRLFERFYRVDAARAREAGGTGLGLAIVKHIVQRHAGTVKVQHGPHGKGTEFICSFPA